MQPALQADVPSSTQTKPIAHWLHTFVLFLLLACTTFFGHRHAVAFVQESSKPLRYGLSILMEWLLLAVVLAGIHQRRSFLRQALTGGRASFAQAILLGIRTYLLGFIAIAVVAIPIHFTALGHRTNEAVILAMLPHTPWQILCWFGLSFTAGLCEELIFRGYLQQQLTAYTGSAFTAILLSALLFGLVHLYEGLAAILPLSALAIVYGLVVRRSGGDLRAVIIAHTLQDFLVAMLALARPLLEQHQRHG